MRQHQPRPTDPARLPRLAAALAVAAATLAVGGLATASGQGLTERFDETQSKLSDAVSTEGVLTSRISRESETLERLEGEVAGLRSREARVVGELRRKQAELDRAQHRLELLREHLRRSIAVLEDRLIAIYKSGEPDYLTVVLQADGFDDLVERAGYLQALENQDSTIVERVRELRNEMEETVDLVKAARDQIARRRQELARTRIALEARAGELAAARRRHRATLSEVREQRKRLEGDLTAISEKIAEQLGTGAPLPAGPIRPGSSGMIWPVNGPVVSGFGYRWGRMHEGIDIAVPSGTPIRAAASGNIVLAGYNGGYGNYTCIDHGGGLSTCYAHQSSYARTAGFVGIGTVIGYVGCTGHCYGDHLHFEVRVNGTAVDPLGYL
jgi:murein DD-endopeptidase MepM/ murein hydrolase activator NlpD